MKHLCPRCGRFIKWALMFCFDCNAHIDPDTLPSIGGQVQYPQATDNHN
jgi:hypothetical protein